MISPTSNEQALLSQVDRAIRTVLKVDGRQIVPTMTLIGDLGAESIDLLDISCELEKQIDAEVDLRKVFDHRKTDGSTTATDISVQDIIEYIRARA